MTLLEYVEAWADREPAVTAQARQDLTATLFTATVALDGHTTPQPPVPRPLRNPDDEGPEELLIQVTRLFRAGVQGASEPALRRICRILRRKLEQLPEATAPPCRREPALRAGAIAGQHRPVADQPTARERLRQDQEADPWDD